MRLTKLFAYGFPDKDDEEEEEEVGGADDAATTKLFVDLYTIDGGVSSGFVGSAVMSIVSGGGRCPLEGGGGRDVLKLSDLSTGVFIVLVIIASIRVFVDNTTGPKGSESPEPFLGGRPAAKAPLSFG